MKTTITNDMRERTDMSSADANRAFDEVTKSMQAVLKRGDKVKLPGIGTLSVKEYAPRTGRNPQTGEQISIGAKRKPKLTVSKDARF